MDREGGTHGSEELVEQPPLHVETVLQAELVGWNLQRQVVVLVRAVIFGGLTGVDTLLGALDRDPSLASDLASDLDGLVDNAALLDDARDETPRCGLSGSEVLARQDNLHGAGLAEGVRETLRSSCTGDDSEL